MSSFTAPVSNFSLTSTWTVSYNGSYYSIAVAPNTDSADKTFDFTGIPTGSVINSATLTATMNSPSTGAALRTVDGGSFSGSKSVSITPGGYNTFRFRFKANGSAGAPTGVKSSTLSFSDVTITVDYTPPGGGGGGGTPPPGPYIGNLAVDPTSITAGGSLYIATGSCYENLIRHISIYRADTNVFVATVVANHGTDAGAWMFPIPVGWCEFAPNDTQFQLRIELYAHYPDGGWGGVENKTVTIYVPEDIKPTIGSLTAAYNANGVNGAITKYVQNYSKVDLAMGSVSGAYGSSIVSYEITGGGFSALNSSATFGPFSQTGDITFAAKVTDTRGRTATTTATINVLSYGPPAFSTPEAWRSNYDGVKNQRGTYARLKSGASYSDLGGQNTITLKGRVYIKGGAVPAWTSMTPGTAWIAGGGLLLVTKTYIVQMEVADLIGSRSIEFTIPTKKTGISIMAGMKGVAVGKVAETPDIFESAWPIVALGMPPNPNLLHNWDFRNPINQRGVGNGYVPSYRYTLDRWLASANVWMAIGSTVNLPVHDGTPKYIDQRVEWDLRGKTYTISVDLDGVGIKSGVINYPSNGAETPVAYEGLFMSLARIGDYDTVRIINWNEYVEYRIKRVKLELGTVSTFHLDPPVDRAIELLKCQRYFQVRSTGNVNATDLRPNVRIVPTITGSGPYYYSADL